MGRGGRAGGRGRGQAGRGGRGEEKTRGAGGGAQVKGLGERGANGFFSPPAALLARGSSEGVAGTLPPSIQGRVRPGGPQPRAGRRAVASGLGDLGPWSGGDGTPEPRRCSLHHTPSL